MHMKYKTSKLSFSVFKVYLSVAGCELRTCAGNDTNGKQMTHSMCMNISCVCHTYSSFLIFVCAIFEHFESISLERLFSFPTASLLCHRCSFLMFSFAAFILESMKIYNFSYIYLHSFYYSFHLNRQTFWSIRGARWKKKRTKMENANHLHRQDFCVVAMMSDE